MSRYLFVGDPHAEVHDLADCLALARYIIKLARNLKATIVLAGDLYHTHAIIHSEVQLFWYNFYEACRKTGIRVITIKGNHDAPGTEGSKATALIAHVEQCTAVLYGPHVEGGVLFCPYTSGAQLVEWSAAHSQCKTLFCHQTFDGSVYENGFFAGDGVDPNLITQDMIISGHIHTPQAFGKVWYPGAPRWRTLSDANVQRAAWLLEFDESGRLVGKKAYDTGAACRRILQATDTPAAPLDPETVLADSSRAKDVYHVTITGPRAWIAQRRPLFEPFARVKTVCTDARAAARVKESEGVGVAFGKWLDAFEPRHGTAKPVLKKLVEERLHDFH